MAQEPFDPLTSAGASRPAQGKADSTAEIKSEIERTRAEMSSTLGEIQERLSPDHLIQQARETVSEAATGKVRNIMHSASETAQRVAQETQYAGRTAAHYARSHPIQMAVLAGGVTWFMLRNADRSYEWAGASEGWDRNRELHGDEPGTMRERAGEYASSARETVNEYADSARQSARRATARVRDAAGSVRQAALQRWDSASTSVDDWVHEYPFAAGAIAVAVGAAIGLSVRSTAFEDRTLGRTRDQAWDRASQAARELTDNVTQTVNQVAEDLTDAARPPATPGTTPAGTGRV